MANMARFCCCQKCPASLVATFASVAAAELCLDTGGGLPGSVKGTSLDVNGSHEIAFSSFDSSTNRCLYLGTITDGATITEYTAANDCTGATTVHVVDANVFIWYDRVTEKIDRLSLTAALGGTTFWIFGAPQQGGASDALAFDLGDAEPNVVLAANTRIGSGGTVTVDLS